MMRQMIKKQGRSIKMGTSCGTNTIISLTKNRLTQIAMGFLLIFGMTGCVLTTIDTMHNKQ